MPVFLAVGEMTPDQAVEFRSILRAARAFKAASERFGIERAPDAVLFLSPDRTRLEETPAVPDFQLSMLPDGRVRAWQVKERRYG